MTTSDNGIAMGQFFEGFSATPNNDPDGNAQVGYGCRLHSGPVDDCGLCSHYKANPLTPQQGDAMYRQHVREICEPRLNRLLATFPLTQNQYDALSDFVYNEGDFTNDTEPGKFKSNHLIICFREGRLNDVPDQLMRWVYGDGKVLPGLVRRRTAEVQMWQWGTWQAYAVPARTQGAASGN